jgi:hypothetical protein
MTNSITKVDDKKLRAGTVMTAGLKTEMIFENTSTEMTETARRARERCCTLDEFRDKRKGCGAHHQRTTKSPAPPYVLCGPLRRQQMTRSAG